MVMTDENAAGIGQNGCLKDFSSCCDNHTGCADTHFREVDDVPTVIQVEDKDTFSGEVSQVFFHEFQDFFGRRKMDAVGMMICFFEIDTGFHFCYVIKYHDLSLRLESERIL